MSTQSITSGSASSMLQITGLASGLDTNSIIKALLFAQQQRITGLTNTQSTIKALDAQLTSFQLALQGVAQDAQALNDPGLFSPTQTASSTDPTLIGATTTSSGVGAVSGGYQVSVSALATSAQKSFTFTSPTSAATFTIDGATVNLAAGDTATTLANTINSGSFDVWAAVNSDGTIVLSQRTTGNMNDSTALNPNANPNYINVADTTGTLTQTSAQAAANYAGTDASFTVNGGSAQTSWTNTVTSAIPGVTLTLNGTTSSTAPVTVNVSTPAPDAKAIAAAVNTFVSAYNSIVGQISTQISAQPPKGQSSKGTLFGDEELTDLLSDMRSSMYTPGAGLPSGMAALTDIGITTGAGSGGASSQSSLEGQLTVNTATLTSAIQSNPQGVKQVLSAWSSNFSAIVNAAAEPGGALDARLQGDGSLVSGLGDQINTLNEMLQTRQAALTQQFASLESVLSQSQSQGTWLSGQITSLATSGL